MYNFYKIFKDSEVTLKHGQIQISVCLLKVKCYYFFIKAWFLKREVPLQLC